jgi:hypothetical protein
MNYSSMPSRPFILCPPTLLRDSGLSWIDDWVGRLLACMTVFRFRPHLTIVLHPRTMGPKV